MGLGQIDMVQTKRRCGKALLLDSPPYKPYTTPNYKSSFAYVQELTMWDSRSYIRRFSQAVKSGEYHQLSTLRVSVFADTIEHIQREQYLSHRGKTILLPRDEKLTKESILYTKKLADSPTARQSAFTTMISVSYVAVGLSASFFV